MKVIKTINQSGSIFYSNENSKWHREDGPAVEYVNGNKFWYINGELHREDGPACEYYEGTKVWYIKGSRHRENGPAFEVPDGRKYYYLNGIRYDEVFNITSDEEWIKLVPKILLLGD
jgi:hypothetical protein